MTNDLNDHISDALPRSLSILNFHRRSIKVSSYFSNNSFIVVK